MNNEIKDKITLEILLNGYVKEEETKDATKLKKELINDLINKKVEYIGVFKYYYEIIKLNENK